MTWLICGPTAASIRASAITGRATPVGVLDLEGTFALAASNSALYVGGDDGVAITKITAKGPANAL